MYVLLKSQEINDDDFKHQPSPLKKVKQTLIQNAVVPNEQIYKYARILTNFLKTINEGNPSSILKIIEILTDKQ